MHRSTIPSHELRFTLYLEPLPDSAPYSMMPTTFGSGMREPFYLGVSTDRPCSFEEVDAQRRRLLRSWVPSTTREHHINRDARTGNVAAWSAWTISCRMSACGPRVTAVRLALTDLRRATESETQTARNIVVRSSARRYCNWIHAHNRAKNLPLRKC